LCHDSQCLHRPYLPSRQSRLLQAACGTASIRLISGTQEPQDVPHLLKFFLQPRQVGAGGERDEIGD